MNRTPALVEGVLVEGGIDFAYSQLLLDVDTRRIFNQVAFRIVNPINLRVAGRLEVKQVGRVRCQLHPKPIAIVAVVRNAGGRAPDGEPSARAGVDV